MKLIDKLFGSPPIDPKLQQALAGHAESCAAVDQTITQLKFRNGNDRRQQHIPRIPERRKTAQSR